MSQNKEFKPLSPSEEYTVAESLTRSKVQMLMGFPFFGILAFGLLLEPTYKTETAATDGKKFYYNPYFIKEMKEAERNWIVVHEILHPALKHMWRRGTRNHKKFNYACDYAIHCIMMEFVEASSKSEHRDKLKMPKGCLYNKKFEGLSAEQIYDLLPDNYEKNASFGSAGDADGPGCPTDGTGDGLGTDSENNTPFDDHSMWDNQETQEDSQKKSDYWDSKMIAAAKSAASKLAGSIPGFLKRLIGNLEKPQKDWRVLLAEFVQPEIDDYSFNPPDRRFSENECMLPDFNDTTDKVEDILFYIDTSGSIGDKELTVAYGEILGAINQFQNHLKGKLGFFDHIAYELHDFENVTDVLSIKPEGGGGTSFHAPFEYINEKCQDNMPVGIIILTDGYASFPEEKIANNIPVLWLIVNEEVIPPWGLHSTLKI